MGRIFLQKNSGSETVLKHSVGVRKIVSAVYIANNLQTHHMPEINNIVSVWSAKYV